MHYEDPTSAIDQASGTGKARFWLGSLCALISAITFSLNMTLAGISYQYGANIHALNLARGLTFLVCLLIMVATTRASFVLPIRARIMSLIVGILLCLEMYVLLGAIRTIPVALAILFFYTYPVLIAVYGWLRGLERFSIASFILMGIAFAGLVIVLVDSSSHLDFSGLGFSIAAAVIMAAMLITSERSLNNHNNYVVLTHSLAAVTSVIVILTLTLVDLEWPIGHIGWIAFAGSTLFYVIATFLLFKAVSFFGPLKTAIIDNTAPVWAMIFGYLLLQQHLSLQQIFGAFVVVASVMTLQWVSHLNTNE